MIGGFMKTEKITPFLLKSHKSKTFILLNGLDPSYGSDIQNVFPYRWSLVKVTVRTVCIFKPFINELFTV